MISGITEQEWEILQKSPAIGVSILGTKYSNNSAVLSALNSYIKEHKLDELKDDWGHSIIKPVKQFKTENEFMMQAILQDSVKLFNPVFTHEVQKIMLDSLKFSRYVLRAMEDCINNDAISCLKCILSHDYTRDRLLYQWLPNATVSRYWFKAVSRYANTVNTIFVDTGLIDRLDPLDRDVIFYMITDSAIRCCNLDVFKWCMENYWKDTYTLIMKYKSEPYLNEGVLMAFFELSGNG